VDRTVGFDPTGREFDSLKGLQLYLKFGLESDELQMRPSLMFAFGPGGVQVRILFQVIFNAFMVEW
jgi:hypothetical protein